MLFFAWLLVDRSATRYSVHRHRRDSASRHDGRFVLDCDPSISTGTTFLSLPVNSWFCGRVKQVEAPLLL